MPGVRKRRETAPQTTALSILYLRCHFVGSIIVLPSSDPFNSLFEMLEQFLDKRSKCVVALSILYLRCREELTLTLHNLIKMSFNSLFEMLLTPSFFSTLYC